MYNRIIRSRPIRGPDSIPDQQPLGARTDGDSVPFANITRQERLGQRVL
jgi:hypothetical protein